jgi:hypothetical protein
MQKIIRDPIVLFPPNSKRADPLPVLKIGDRVRVKGREWLGCGTVISFDKDGRLINLSFASVTGWWNRADLRVIRDGENHDQN